MSLASLPRETIIHILALAGPATVRHSQEVSRLLRIVVVESPLLQYILALDTCGYVEPLVPRKELGLVDRVKMLHAHSNRRVGSGPIPPVQIRIQVPRTQGLGVNLRGYHEGIYAQYSRSTRLLSLYQLSSLNHGTEHKVWHHSSPAPTTVGLTIHATLDLLVWLEALHPGPFRAQAAANQEYRYKLHLCSLTTGLQHPEASAGPITYTFTAPRTIARHTIHVLGDLLAVLFVSVRERIPSRVVVWNWTTGLELA
ncbi:hypothetical protein FS749_000801, partial [Ceratobasidium sp. UAMH 11750]